MFSTMLSNGCKCNKGVRVLTYSLAGLLLNACASGPIQAPDEIASLSVAQARSQISTEGAFEAADADPVLWGGVILGTQNLADATQIEVMAYPLDRRQRPMLGRDAQGRFLVRYDSYLEPVDYAEGRSITLLGRISGLTDGTVGEAQYQYPTVEASDIHLWNENEPGAKPGFTFGIGVNIGL